MPGSELDWIPSLVTAPEELEEPIEVGSTFVYAPFDYDHWGVPLTMPEPLFELEEPIQVAPTDPWPGGSTGNTITARRLAGLLSRGDRYAASLPPGIVTTRIVGQDGDFVYVRVDTNLTGRAYFHWFVNGRYHGRTRSNNRTFRVPLDRRINVVVKVVRWKRYSGRDNPPEALSGELTLQWIKSASGAVAWYWAQYKAAGGAWTTFAKVRDDGRWSYRVTTPQLDDSTDYDFQVVPVDAVGNQGTALALGSQRVVRWPDPTVAEITWDQGTSRFGFGTPAGMPGEALDWLPPGPWAAPEEPEDPIQMPPSVEE